MTPQVKSQILGLSLGLATAVGCIFYEKLVSNFSFATLWLAVSIDVVLFRALGFFFFQSDALADYHKFMSDKTYWVWLAIYVATGITGMLWYKITKDSGVMVGSIYEVKYIVMLAIIYIMFGEDKFTLNTGIGVFFALISIYFISKK